MVISSMLGMLKDLIAYCTLADASCHSLRSQIGGYNATFLLL
jgi:hypothetical protein